MRSVVLSLPGVRRIARRSFSQLPKVYCRQVNYQPPDMLSSSQQTRLDHQHESVGELIKGFSEEVLRMRPESGKWSPFENFAHLAAYQPAFLERLKKIEKEDCPLFERYVAENDPKFFECVELSLPQLHEHFSTHRFLIINHISALPDTLFKRIGKHSVYGELSIPEWVEFFLLHEAHHLYTIFKLVNATSR